MKSPPFPFDPRQLYYGMTHEGVYYEVTFVHLSLRSFVAQLVKPDELAGATIWGPSIPCFAMPTFRGYVHRRQQPTFWLIASLSECIVHKNFSFDVDLSKIKPWNG